MSQPYVDAPCLRSATGRAHWETAQDAFSLSAFYGKKSPALPELTDRFWGGADRAIGTGPRKALSGAGH